MVSDYWIEWLDDGDEGLPMLSRRLREVNV